MAEEDIFPGGREDRTHPAGTALFGTCAFESGNGAEDTKILEDELTALNNDLLTKKFSHVLQPDNVMGEYLNRLRRNPTPVSGEE